MKLIPWEKYAIKSQNWKKVNELNLFWFEVNEMRLMETGTVPKHHPWKWYLTCKYIYWPILVRVLLKAIVKEFHNLMLWTLGKIPPILNPNRCDSPLHSPFYFITSFSQNWPLSVCPFDFGLLKGSHSSTSQARQYPAQSCWCGRCPRSPRANQTHISHKMCSCIGRDVSSQTRFVRAFPKVVFI